MSEPAGTGRSPAPGMDPGDGAGARATDGPIARFSRWLETAVLAALLAAMIGLASAQVLLRGSFGSSLIWADEALWLLVLWATMVGAVAAARDNVHLRIDFLSRFLKPRGRRIAALATNLFAALVSGILAWESLRFVDGSREFGDQVLGTWPAWLVQAVLPVTFALIAWRYLHDCWRELSGSPPLADGREP